MDIKCDNVPIWPDQDEVGYGLKMTYRLEHDGDDPRFQFDDHGLGDMGNTHSLVVLADSMQKQPWWNPESLRVKWEGLDGSITDEQAHRIYKWPGEAEESGAGVSPVHTVREGTYKLTITMKHKDDADQPHMYEVVFDVDYGVDF